MRVSNQTLDHSRREMTVAAAPPTSGATLPMTDAEAVVVRWAGVLYAWLTGLCRDRDRAADLTQESFAAYWAAAQREKIANPRAWLFRTARNLFLADLRLRRRNLALDDEDACAATDPAAARIEADDADRVRAAVLGMPRTIREPIVLRYWCELPDAEIAAVLRVPVFVVRWRIHRGKAWLRTQLPTLNPSGGDTHVPR